MNYGSLKKLCLGSLLMIVISALFLSTDMVSNASSQQVADDSKMQELRARQVGSVPELVTHDAYLGELPSSEELVMVISFQTRNEEELQRLNQELYDPSSPNYHKWITTEEFGERFGRSEAEFVRAI